MVTGVTERGYDDRDAVLLLIDESVTSRQRVHNLPAG